jgi:hypothetical protein
MDCIDGKPFMHLSIFNTDMNLDEGIKELG